MRVAASPRDPLLVDASICQALRSIDLPHNRFAVTTQVMSCCTAASLSALLPITPSTYFALDGVSSVQTYSTSTWNV